jgi:hypothetical protein
MCRTLVVSSVALTLLLVSPTTAHASPVSSLNGTFRASGSATFTLDQACFVDISENGSFSSTATHPIPPLQTGSYHLAVCVTTNDPLFGPFFESGTFTITTTTGTLSGPLSGEDLGCEGRYEQGLSVSAGTHAFRGATGSVAISGIRSNCSVNQFLVGSYTASETWMITLTAP